MLRTVLIVDTDLLFVEQIRQRFLSMGYRVLCAQNEAEAEEIFSATRPDVMITEVMLRHQDGGFCLAWKLKRKYPDVPVVMVSAVTWHTGLFFSLSSPGSRDWIQADAFIDKPVRTDALISAVQSVLQPGLAA
jgi:DNA-binding response OmpR family regulator